MRYPHLDRDDLVQEGWLGAILGTSSYNPALGGLTTWVYRQAFYAMLTYAKRETTRMAPDPESLPDPAEITDSPGHRQDAVVTFYDELLQLSDEAFGVVSVILDTPLELVREVARNSSTAKCIRGLLFRHLRSKGWSHPAIWRAFGELRRFCRGS